MNPVTFLALVALVVAVVAILIAAVAQRDARRTAGIADATLKKLDDQGSVRALQIAYLEKLEDRISRGVELIAKAYELSEEKRAYAERGGDAGNNG